METPNDTPTPTINPGHSHRTKYGYGDWVFHRVTGDRGMIMGIELRPSAAPCYFVCWDDSRCEDVNNEFELTTEAPLPPPLAS